MSDYEVTGISLVNPWDFVPPEPDPVPEAVIFAGSQTVAVGAADGDYLTDGGSFS